MESRKCLHCGTEFTGKKNKKFCSDSCKSMNHQKKRTVIVKTVTENKPITKEFLQAKFPAIPDRLLFRMNRIEKLYEVRDIIKSEIVREQINREILMLEDICEFDSAVEDMEKEDQHIGRIMRKQLNVKLEKEKIFYAKRREQNELFAKEKKIRDERFAKEKEQRAALRAKT